MFIDLFIILAALGEFCVFWMLHVLLFRFISYESVFKWLISLYVFTTTTYAALFLMLRHLMIAVGVYDTLMQLVVMTTILVIASLLTGIYIIGIFGIIESSIRIKLLNLVTQAKTSGITYKDITNVYNKQIILNKRIQRLQSSGDIIRVAGKYYAPKRFSAFFLVAQITKFIAYLYR